MYLTAHEKAVLHILLCLFCSTQARIFKFKKYRFDILLYRIDKIVKIAMTL
jgi:hypothetical protein